MKTLGEFLKEHNAGPGFKFTRRFSTLSSREVIFIGNESVFVKYTDDGKENVIFLYDRGDWEIVQESKKKIKIKAYLSLISGYVDLMSEDSMMDNEYEKCKDRYIRVPSLDTECEIEE